MQCSRKTVRTLLIISCLAECPTLAWADGFVLNKLGTYVPEKEQHAYLEWEGGRERLYVATRTEAIQGPALWIVPIPSQPAQVVAEPVELFPRVTFTEPYVKKGGDAGGEPWFSGCVP